MRQVKEPFGVRMQQAFSALFGRLPRSRRATLIAGTALAAMLCALVAVYNIDAGPLRNLNDIGGWNHRLLYILMAAAVQGALLVGVTLVHRGGYARLALRQLILTAGFVIALLPINQKTYAFVEQMLPLIRAMDAGGLAAIPQLQTNLSSPALTILYLITRGPIYDMYMVKLACVAALCVLGIAALHVSDRLRLGIRAEVVFAFCLILPQGFMSAGCAAQFDVIAAALLALSLMLTAREKPFALAGALLFGLSVSVSGAMLYALPVYITLILRGRMKTWQLAAGAAAPLALCVPAIACGQNAVQALVSPLKAVFGAPQYASGMPNIMNFFPRAAMEEMPEYFMLSQLEQIDPVTNFSPYYTQTSFATIMAGMALLGLAVYALIWALVLRRDMSDTARALAIALAAALCCPGVTAGGFLLVSVMAMVAIFAQRDLRVPACMVLFAAAGAAAYPVTGEILLPMIVALALCLLALFALLGMFDANAGKGEKAHGC